MTRKDYVLLATQVANAYDLSANDEQVKGVKLVEVSLVTALLLDNPRFNISKWEAAIIKCKRQTQIIV